MVLWEITLGTAYFLGLKRTYRLALKIQRLVISSKHPKTRSFVHRRTRVVFDVALRVHRSIQERDIEVGRSVGNWILRWLDRMKPSAQIRGSSPELESSGMHMNTSIHKQVSDTSPRRNPSIFKSPTTRGCNSDSDRHLFASPPRIRLKSFPTLAMMIRPVNPTGSQFQYRQITGLSGNNSSLSFGLSGFHGFIREDIMQWMLQK